MSRGAQNTGEKGFPTLGEELDEHVRNLKGDVTQQLNSTLQVLRTQFSQLKFFMKTLDSYLGKDHETAGAAQGSSADAGAAQNYDDEEEAKECDICLEELDVSNMSITGPCAHVFCTPCLTETVKISKHCPTCRQPCSEKDILPLTVMQAERDRLEQEEKEGKKAEEEEREMDLAVFGSKIKAVAEKIFEIKDDDPTAKIIVFVQWDSLRNKLFDCFSAFGMNHCSLDGGAHLKMKLLKNFQKPVNLETRTTRGSWNKAAMKRYRDVFYGSSESQSRKSFSFFSCISRRTKIFATFIISWLACILCISRAGVVHEIFSL